MHFDFEAFLTIVSLITGVLWLISFTFKKKNTQTEPEIVQEKSLLKNIIEQVGSFFPVLLFVLVVRTFIFEPFRIPSSSMMPTLLTGDFIYVNKFSYGLKMPVLHDTIIEVGHPKRGDIIVFRYPRDQSVDYIKRVVGLPGDKIRYDIRKKELYINGELMPQEYIGNYKGLMDEAKNASLIEKYEQLGDKKHLILTKNHAIGPTNFIDVTVPEGHYFAMGDNRDNSADSREWGFVPERNLVGRAVFIWMHWRTDHFFQGLKRIGTKLI
ncbi:MAG TPA: signal peptidase I [Oceanospirillales bacterium]|nr:signal peptidase I [Oceanospirillales bacterium]